MISYEELYTKVKDSVSEYRFKHIEAVVKRAMEYATIYGVDIETVRLVALAHDIAKERTKEQIEADCQKYKISFDAIEAVTPALWHAKIGAFICKEEFGFTEDMVNAILYHTTGRANMTLLEKIIYLADATEETREETLLKYVPIIKKDINQGMYEVIKFSLNRLLCRGSRIHENTIACYNDILQYVST